MADGPKKFGRYFLLDLLAQGGMAEIYRARLASADGAGRLIVIKRIQGSHGTDNEFIQMFRSEIKVTMGFNHPNIVQLYDFGEEQNQPYIAMEWVDGKNLRQLMSRFIELKQKFPIDLAVQIIEQAASGLNYAHQFKDKISGTPLNIVHRDISPQNLIVSFEGCVKVIDFGIAKASVNSEATRAGVIKGKPSYLSPEQINGDPLDGRSDIFSLGAVLWELLVGKKLFSGDSDLAILKQIESCNTYVKPPSTHNSDVPAELDYIVLKALAKQREKRYQTAEELQRALHKFLYSHAPDFNPSDLTYYAKDLFKNEIVDDRKKIQRLNDEVERLIQNPVPPAMSVTTDGISDVSLELTEKHQPERDSTILATKNKTIPLASADQSAKIQIVSDRQGHAGGASPKTGFGAASAPAANRAQQPQRTSPSVERSGSRTIETPEKEGSSFASVAAAGLILIGAGLFFAKNMGYLGSNQASVSKPQDTSRRIANFDSPNAESGVAEPAAPTAQGKTILLKLNLAPGGGNPAIKLNGQAIDPEKPTVKVPMDSLLELSVERKGYRSFTRQFFIESSKAGDQSQWNVDVQLEPVEYGTLFINTTPSAEAMIMMDGKPWVKNTPFDKEIMLPVGTYLVQMNNKGLGMGKTIKVSIERGKALQLNDVHLDVLDK